MPHQVALTLAAKVPTDKVESLRQLLESMGDGVANDSVIDFNRFDGVHFARFVLLEEATDLDGKPLPAQLLYLSDLDISRERHLGELVDLAGDGHRPALRALRGLSGAPAEDARRAARLPAAAPDPGAGVLREHDRPLGRQIREESELRDRLEEFLDGADGLRTRTRRRSGARCRSTSSPTARSAGR